MAGGLAHQLDAFLQREQGLLFRRRRHGHDDLVHQLGCAGYDMPLVIGSKVPGVNARFMNCPFPLVWSQCVWTRQARTSPQYRRTSCVRKGLARFMVHRETEAASCSYKPGRPAQARRSAPPPNQDSLRLVGVRRSSGTRDRTGGTRTSGAPFARPQECARRALKRWTFAHSCCLELTAALVRKWAHRAAARTNARSADASERCFPSKPPRALFPAHHGFPNPVGDAGRCPPFRRRRAPAVLMPH